MDGPSDVYLLGRDPKESARLNAQHDFLINLIGASQVHSSIPTDSITSVADIATGTGIWLSTLDKSLPPPPPSSPRYFHGFDISPEQFPRENDVSPTRSIRLSVHNICERFPEEHRGRYDLVHLRLLAGALKEADYAVAVKNVCELLKKGGHLQWDDCDTTAFTTTPSTPQVTQMRQIIADGVCQLGLCATAPQRVEKLLLAQGVLTDVRREVFSTVDKPGLHGVARAWLVEVLRSLLPRSLLAGGEVSSEEEAMARTEGLVGALEGTVGKTVPVVNLQVVVGRKG
ncbi:putative LaeA-like methyltransferase [Aspergillus candidus]|uniref:Putative LaeA-like methyltransferase n=1 Tax=Aspergillus candidus TaxID=41067 RepID=A0A2I2FL84_ASPCN|nr:putative LaeA-like methyltransferase [Aspergillus candidus]PLB41386.1 putative LaeA-like methyltransferase [Aspergillus candidus]